MNEFKLFIPAQEITVKDPNAMGELLRAMFFRDHDGENHVGGYTTMDWADKVRPLERILVDPEDEEFPMYWTRGELEGIECRWYWDGDGTLEFEFPDGGILSNTDCKKDYRWDYLPPNVEGSED